MQSFETINLELDEIHVAKHITCDIEDVNKHIITKSGTLNLLSQNIRSITCNLPNFMTLLQRSSLSWDILVLSECWLRSGKCIPPIDKYNFVSTTIHRSQNEGVVIYYKNHLKITHEEPSILDANCLLLKINAHTCIIGIYRPPSQHNITPFINSLDNLLSGLVSYRQVIICGDINIDIAANSSDKRSSEYLNLLASHGMLSGHNVPTHGLTCLDHMMVKSKLNPICLTIESSITDHDSVALNFNLCSDSNYNNIISHSIDFDGLDADIHGIKIGSLLECSDVNTATDLLVTELTDVIKNNTKTRKIPARQRISKPWITRGLMRCMRNRDNLHKKLKRDPDNEMVKTTYKRYRNFCNNLIKKANRDYEKQEIENAKDNKKQLWDTIKKISGSSKTTDHSPSLIQGDNPVNDINFVNSYFIDIGKRIAEKTQSSARPRLDSHFSPNSNALDSLVMLPTDEREIFSLIQGLKNKCAVGIDLITTKIVKRYAHILTGPLTHIFNLALSTGVFPKKFKIAVIKPIYKGGDRTCVDNYRPISILPILSKILERIINSRLTNYLENNNLLSASQFGFRGGKSTNDAVHVLLNKIVENLDSGKKSLAIFLDIKKAFDTVSIPLLLRKLESIGVRGIPLKLMEDYLTDRRQRVRIGEALSEEQVVKYGVPQGSVVGPTLFLVFINDLCQLTLASAKIVTFADDTAVLFTGESWASVFTAAQEGFDHICEWLIHNSLTLNVNKTKYMVFAHRISNLPPSTLYLKAHDCFPVISSCSCPKLERVDSIKYLGITFDPCLTFKLHIEIMVVRLRKLIYIFKCLRHSAQRPIIKIVYHALCQSLVEYCITIWGGAAKTHIIEAERAQRAILKVAAGLPFRYSTEQLFKDWDLLTVRQIFILKTVLKNHSQLNYNANLNKDKRRKARICPVINSKLAHTRKFFCYLGPYLYNKLNAKLNIYAQLKPKCKKLVSNYLKSLNYQETENLLKPLV